MTKLSHWFVALLAAAIAGPALAAPMPTEGSTAEGGPPAARISYLDGTVYCWGPYDDGKRNLMLNDLIREGDELYAAPGTFVEVEFPGGTYLRLDEGSSVVVSSYHDDIQLIPSAGAFYISTGDWTEAFMTFGPDSADVASASVARMDISPSERRSIAVVYGLARLNNHEAIIEVAENQIISSDDFSSPWASGEFYPDEGDVFDEWSMEREFHLRGEPEEDTPSYPLVGYGELQDQGNWVVVDEVWVWKPYYVSTDWRPYSCGEWVWYEGYGWTWVSCYGWGYVTSHHGRWHYDAFYGWVWMPGMVWSPAWVSWSVFDGYVGWCAMGWWGWPVVMTVGWYSYWDYRCWVGAHYHYFYHGGYSHHGSYYYHHYHHHTGNSYPRPSGSHGSGDHGTSASNSRDDMPGSSHDRGSMPSHSRDGLASASSSNSRLAGGEFQTFGQSEFDSMRRSPIENANNEILRSSVLSSDERAAFERGGDSRTQLLEQRHDFSRSETAGSRTSRGKHEGRSTTLGGQSDTGGSSHGGLDRTSSDGGDRGSFDRDGGRTTTLRPDGRGSLTGESRASGSDAAERTWDRSVNERRTSGDRGNWTRDTNVHSAPDRSRSDAPTVPQYSGRSDGTRYFESPYSDSRRSSSSSTSNYDRTYQPSSSSTDRSSWSRSNSSNRSSTTRSNSNNSSSSSRKKRSSSSSSSRSSSKKKKKK